VVGLVVDLIAANRKLLEDIQFRIRKYDSNPERAPYHVVQKRAVQKEHPRLTRALAFDSIISARPRSRTFPGTYPAPLTGC